jgi:hypothetical protein
MLERNPKWKFTWGESRNEFHVINFLKQESITCTVFQFHINPHYEVRSPVSEYACICGNLSIIRMRKRISGEKWLFLHYASAYFPTINPSLPNNSSYFCVFSHAKYLLHINLSVWVDTALSRRNDSTSDTALLSCRYMYYKLTQPTKCFQLGSAWHARTSVFLLRNLTSVMGCEWISGERVHVI